MTCWRDKWPSCNTRPCRSPDSMGLGHKLSYKDADTFENFGTYNFKLYNFKIHYNNFQLLDTNLSWLTGRSATRGVLLAAHIHLRPCWEQSERRHWGRVTPQWYIPAQSLSDYWLTAITKSQEAPSLHHVTTTRGPKWRNCPPVTLFHPFFVAKASLEKPFIKLPVFPKASFFILMLKYLPQYPLPLKSST